MSKTLIFIRTKKGGKFLVLFIISWLYMSLVPQNIPFRKEKAFVAFTKDSVQLEVDLIFNANNEPMQYYSYVVSPVCEEGMCYNLVAELYWDLLGNFIDYKEVPMDPFTKFDHIKFSPEDHAKMKEILKNKTSLLANYKAKDLVDHRIQIKSEVIDGVAGATYASLSGAVVSGAVYSSHTLWHIVNGELANKMVTHTESMMNEKLWILMLNSDNYQYQFYALNKMPIEDKKYIPYLIKLVSKGSSYVPYFAIEKLPDWVWSSAKYQSELILFLKKVEFQMQNEILNRLNNRHLDENALMNLISSLVFLNKTQLGKAFKIIENQNKKLPPFLIKEILTLLDTENKELATAAYQFLVSQEKEYGFITSKIKKYRKKLLLN